MTNIAFPAPEPAVALADVAGRDWTELLLEESELLTAFPKVYLTYEYQPGFWGIICHQIEFQRVNDGGVPESFLSVALHRGRRTGEIVRFSRLADAVRLCRVLRECAPAEEVL